VRRADFRHVEAGMAFSFPHLRDDEAREVAELLRLQSYAARNPFRFDAWLRKVDSTRPPCDCPQCRLERNHV
jgi:hypothetical protein